MRFGGRMFLSGLLGAVISSFAASAYAESDYLPPPYREGEQVCGSAVGTVKTMECLAGHLSKARESLEEVISLLTPNDPADSDEAEYRKAFLSAHEAWKRDVEQTCHEMTRLRFGRGTMSRTEPIRCEYLMTRERERLLRLLYYRPLRYLEQRTEE